MAFLKDRVVGRPTSNCLTLLAQIKSVALDCWWTNFRVVRLLAAPPNCQGGRVATMGWTYNTVNPDAKTSAPIIAAVGITFTTVSFVVVALRMYVRGWMIKAIGIGETSTALEEEKRMFC